VKGLRVGVLRHFYMRDMEASAEVRDSAEAALDVLRHCGARIVEINAAPLQDYAACNRVILLSEACAVHARWLRDRPQDYSALTRNRLLPGLFLSATDYVQALRWRARLNAKMEEALANVDVAITASSMDAPYPIGDVAEMERCYPRQARTPFNVTGHPALGVPGLPTPLHRGPPLPPTPLAPRARAYPSTPRRDMAGPPARHLRAHRGLGRWRGARRLRHTGCHVGTSAEATGCSLIE
jgi:Asp-tRNA(Asn)/Glu-tRNA(Gln) amidotransferase A subunit family amidase